MALKNLENNVYVKKIINENIQDSVYQVLIALDINKNPDVKTIGIKINLCDYRFANSGATTDPNILDALLKNIRMFYPVATIYLIENDASGTNADNLYHFLKFDELGKKYSCEFVNLARCEWINKSLNGRYFRNIEIPKFIETCDILINHPKLKTHGMTKVTLGLKNMFGFIRDKYKVKYHPNLDNVIVDINTAIKSSYTIVDGYIGLEGNEGPTYGYPKKCGLIIGGKNSVSVDSFCSKLMGFNPWFISHIRKSYFAGLGNVHFNFINLDEEKLIFKNYRFEFNYIQYCGMKFLSRFI
jgi:uncharacterized protein (DUF362 family)